jgi:hypothetical protein
VFKSLRLRGQGAAVLWGGYRQAATVSAWTVVRSRDPKGTTWTLTATVSRVFPFELRQTPLLFSAPRKGGFWVWPIVGPPRVDRATLSATLGPPEH